MLTSKTVQSEITHLAHWWGCHKTTSKLKAKKQKNKKKTKKEEKKLSMHNPAVQQSFEKELEIRYLIGRERIHEEELNPEMERWLAS